MVTEVGPVDKEVSAGISPRSSWCPNRLMNELLTRWKCLRKESGGNAVTEAGVECQNPQQRAAGPTLSKRRGVALSRLGHGSVSISVWYLPGLIFCSLALFKILIFSAHSPFPRPLGYPFCLFIFSSSVK